jgi:DNA polymerase III delta subunit
MHTAQAGLALFLPFGPKRPHQYGHAMIVITLGPDAALCRAETNRVVAEHDPSGENTSRLDGRTLRIADAITMVGTPPFFGGGRVIVIDDLLARASRGRDDSDAEIDSERPRNGKASLDFAALFAAVHSENVLLLCDPSLSSLPSVIAKQLPKNAQVTEGEPPRGHALIKWMQQRAEESGNAIEPAAAQLLAEMLFPQTWSAKPSNPRFDRPPDLDLLGNEISKLALYAHPEPVGRHHVQELAEAALSDRLFSFVEQSVAGNLGNAVKDLESFDLHGDDGHRVSNQLYQQIELSTVLAAAPSAVEPTAVGRELVLANPQRMYGVARAPRPANPAEIVLNAAETDRRTKTGRLKGVEDALYGMIADLAEAKRRVTERRGRS